MCLLWSAHSYAEHVRVLGPLDDLAGRPSLGACGRMAETSWQIIIVCC